MKTFSFVFYLIFGFAAILLNSCNKENEIVPFPEQPKKPEVNPITKINAYVQSIISDGQPVYSLVLEAECTNHREIEKVVVDGPNKQFELVKDDRFGYVFKKVGNYEPTPPEGGTYAFSIRFRQGQEVTGSTTITPPFVSPSQNAKATLFYDNNDASVLLNWNAVSNADYYVISTISHDSKNNQAAHEDSEKIYLWGNDKGELKMPVYVEWLEPPLTIQFDIHSVDLKDGSTESINSLGIATTDLVVNNF